MDPTTIIIYRNSFIISAPKNEDVEKIKCKKNAEEEENKRKLWRAGKKIESGVGISLKNENCVFVVSYKSVLKTEQYTHI